MVDHDTNADADLAYLARKLAEHGDGPFVIASDPDNEAFHAIDAKHTLWSFTIGSDDDEFVFVATDGRIIRWAIDAEWLAF